MYYDLDTPYQAALLGDMGNIMLPSLFGDTSLSGAYGPCEYGPVRLAPGDVVLDLGACIGEFSCVAAAKGCLVHAFEPTPETVERYLLPNSSLHDNITVVNKAVSDNNGISILYINDTYSESLNITRNSLFRHLEPSYTAINVETISIDDYIDANKIKKVDFIKSHTEYSEVKAFMGAARTIRKFSPKLCYWGSIHASELEKLLLSLNPAYRFDYTWGNKIFAWVDA